jgi:hypothetical protein
MTGTIILKNAVQRRPGYIYYINGNGDICEAVSAVGKGRKKAKAKAAKPAKKKTTTKSKKK